MLRRPSRKRFPRVFVRPSAGGASPATSGGHIDGEEPLTPPAPCLPTAGCPSPDPPTPSTGAFHGR
nr:MAG TPA: hypothetical protein [Caudoviricetes sp.]